MKAGERYFMAAVDLATAKARIEKMLADLEEHKLPPSMELMTACIQNLTDAMVHTHRDRLSDPRFQVTPECEVPGCWESGTHHVCTHHKVPH